MILCRTGNADAQLRYRKAFINSKWCQSYGSRDGKQIEPCEIPWTCGLARVLLVSSNVIIGAVLTSGSDKGYGLNSEGADDVAMRLRQRRREFCYANGFGVDEAAEQQVLGGEAGVPPGSLKNGRLLAINIAKNKFTPDEDLEAIKRDYVYCVETLANYADILVVNGVLHLVQIITQISR